MIALSSVGVVGWRLPHVAVIDLHGLNDYRIARTSPPAGASRHMAHDRRPPPGYVECFRPNVTANLGDGSASNRIAVEERELSDADIIRCESRDWSPD